MNTPAHLLLNSAALGQGRWRSSPWAVGTGAVLPDVPLYLFYGISRLLGRSEAQIWSLDYFHGPWAAVFDWAHSIPLAGLTAALGWALGSAGAAALGVSMMLHDVADLLLHHADGHAHFLPFSDWRFSSPVSYWNPAHHGRIFGTLELGASLACAVLLLRRREGGWRLIGALGGAATLGGWLFARLVWGG